MTDKTIAELTNRVEALESQVAFQEDTIDQLNGEITLLNQNQLLIKKQLALLVEKFKEQKGTVVAHESEETPPPHY